MKQTLQNLTKKQDGFTLHEIAFVILIMGLMTIMFVQGMNVFKKKLDHEKLELAIENAQSVLTNILPVTFSYPCPAPDVPQDNPLFGIESPRDPVTGMCVAGAGITQTPGNGGAPVFIGLFPRQVRRPDNTLAAIQEFINPEAVGKSRQLLNLGLLDPWGNDLTYAISGAQTQLFFDLNAGAISLIDRSGTATRGILNDADYVVLSHGANECPNVAAFAFPCADPAAVAANPTLADQACPPAGGGINMELENCDNDSTFATGPRNNLGAGRRQFDDIVGTFVFRGRDTWDNIRITDAAGTTTERQSVRLSAGIASIGINTAAPQWPLEVNGDTIIEGETSARLLCSRSIDPMTNNTDSNLNNQTCVNPQSLTTNVSCAPGQYMKGFDIIQDPNDATNRIFSINCQDASTDLTTFVTNAGGAISDNSNCPIRGILSDGRIVCL